MFTADNGTSKSYIHTAEDGKYIRLPVFSMIGGQRVRGGKGNFRDDGTHVPLIANWPGTIAPGQVVDDLVDMSDFLPTMADLGGASLPSDIQFDGHTFAPRLRGVGRAERRAAVVEMRGKYFARTQRWKLYGTGKFYDVGNDPEEANPLDVSSLSGKAKAAHQHLSAHLAKLDL